MQVLMGNYHASTSFGVQRKCTSEGECLNVDKGHLHYTDPGTLKSTGSGMKFVNRCWVTKLDTHGEHLWHTDCGDAPDTYEQHRWAEKAAEFFRLNPQDPTGMLGKETNFEDYAKFRKAGRLNTVFDLRSSFEGGPVDDGARRRAPFGGMNYNRRQQDEQDAFNTSAGGNTTS